jgi:hypothetical protein
MMKKITRTEIKTADLFATPPNTWWEKWICRIIGAKTFHWGLFIVSDDRGWVITESIPKGTSLTRFTYPKAYIYRIKGIGEIDPMRITSIHADYGELPYDWGTTVFWTGLWWLLKHYLGIVIRVIHDKAVNCQEWVVLIAYELGVKLIPDNEYPICVNLENSPYLEYRGEVSQ